MTAATKTVTEIQGDIARCMDAIRSGHPTAERFWAAASERWAEGVRNAAEAINAQAGMRLVRTAARPRAGAPARYILVCEANQTKAIQASVAAVTLGPRRLATPMNARLANMLGKRWNREKRNAEHVIAVLVR